MDSKQMVDALLEVDPGFEQLCKTLFGELVEPAEVWDFMYEHDGLTRYMPVAKAMPDQADRAVKTGGRFLKTMRKKGGKAGGAVAAGVTGGVVANQFPQSKRGWRQPNAKRVEFKRYDDDGMHVVAAKSDTSDVVWEGTFSKLDQDKRQAFGWASVVEIDGEPIIDRQGDWITPDEIEKAAYDYVLHNRKGGNQHRRDANDQPIHASDLIESFVVTPEKIEKMGLPPQTPVGWWVGYKVHDDEAWSRIKKGEATGFSIHGRGKRRDVD